MPSNPEPSMTETSVLQVATTGVIADRTEKKHRNEVHPQPVPSLPAPTPFGTLIAIPVEIHLRIYRLLIERGQVAILRTSQAINKEALDGLYQHAVCRLDIDYYYSYKFSSIQVPWSSVQNFELRGRFSSDLNEPCVTYFNEWLQHFSPSMTDLKTCKIRLDYQHRIDFNDETFSIIKTLTAFPKITLAIAAHSEPYAIMPVGVLEDGPQSDLDRDMHLDMHCKIDGHHMLGYKWAAAALGPRLGTAEWIRDGKGMHLEFRPRKNAPIFNLEKKDGESVKKE